MIKRWMMIVLTGLMLAGCSTVGGEIPHGNTTQTVLEKSNYTVLYPVAQGQSAGFKLFGIISFAAPRHSEAMRNLYKNVDVKGKATSLINVSQEYSSAYFILFSIPKITITGDIIEFHKE